ncbi:cytochrome C oxidase subunit IV family protein [Mycobacterium saskatchewanense]|uniref:cytochrome C oxidase subunit IV family protein n=1 Tax=Mycobacterium saskatchewanense TaxID=220927 RepID=UPI001302E611|nr:cytochrome C oxidase subunit IV family protein [Mycobacterium saskatchewanense]
MAAWIALVLLTLSSVAVGELSVLDGTTVTLLVMAIAAIKGSVILDCYMGGRSFPLAWKLFFAVWLIGSTSTIVVLHLSI